MTRRQDKREKLLQIAVDMYARNGSFTARDLTLAAGMNIASLNYYFGSKEDLLQEIEQRLLQIFIQEITDIGSTGGAPYDRLNSLLFAVSERLLKNPGLTRHFVEMLIAGESKVYDMLEQAVGRTSPIFAVFASVLGETGLTDEDEAYRRMIIGVCSLAPVFVIGLNLADSIAVLRNDAFVSSHIETLATVLLAPPALSGPTA
ncbi:MAG TPA: TetR family transcriptional regulator [Clostridia bacterium]